MTKIRIGMKRIGEMKRALTLLLLVASAGFALDWGIYGGPGASFTMTGMSPIHDVIMADANPVDTSDTPNFPGYDVPSFSNYQIGIQTPLVIRLFDFTVGTGNTYSWQTFKGDDWKTTFNHRIDITELGYIIDLDEHMRLRPLIGFGTYNIDMTISEFGGGFGSPDDTSGIISRSYEYDNFCLSAGASFAYLWKIEKHVLLGFEAKARYLLPLLKEEMASIWYPNGDYAEARIPEFYSGTPVVGVNLVIGYENIDEKEDANWEEEEEW